MRASLDRIDLVCVSATLERGVRAPGIAQACMRALWFAWIALLPVALLVFVFQSIRNGHSAWAIDFHGNFRVPAQEILRGSSPYHPAELAHVRAAVAAEHSPIEFQHGVFAAYPAPGLLVGVPFTAIPAAVASWLWFGCLLAAGGLALRLAGVRDWRVYTAAVLAPPVVGSLFYGAVDLVLMLGLAACWRWREHAGRAGWVLGAMVALKLIALPLVLWFAATRRWGAAALSLAVAGILAVAGWAVVGFGELTAYPHLLSLLTDIESTRGYSAVAFADALGAGTAAAAWPRTRSAPACSPRSSSSPGVLRAQKARRSCWGCSRRSRSRPSSGSTRSRCCSFRSPCSAPASASSGRCRAALAGPGHLRLVPAFKLLLFALVWASSSPWRCGAGVPPSRDPGIALPGRSRSRERDAATAIAACRAPRLARAGGRVSALIFLGVLPPALLLAILVGSFRSGTGAWAIDFDGNFFTPARQILHGLSPYHPDELVRVRQAVAAGHRPDEYHDGVFAAYPAVALLLGVPFSFLRSRWPSGPGRSAWCSPAGLRSGSSACAIGASTARRS